MEITVDEYVIMPDHVHILLFADKRNVRRPFPARPEARPDARPDARPETETKRPVARPAAG